ncbi:Clp protease N-terminal domain-containing protein [Rhodococcus sp. ZPP]|uniref:Clp protease N-terminal domain-containing protein n=1 Tax=Rhodococcus sp. ZPP TaxID=2749906 RepID=UPI001FCE0E2E|nr:Clp protease N-terminal domain-containing protein [Rhodococcus sp. ZPP]
MVFEKFSEQARQVVVPPPAPPAPTTRTPSAPNTCPPKIFDAGGPGTAALTSWGVTAPALESKLGGVSAPAGSAPAAGHIPFTPKTKKVLEASLRQTALLGHEEIGTDHLLLALLDDPASTGAQILTDLASLPISKMREHLRRELAHRPTPGPAHRIPIRLSDDEYTRAHAAARTAGQNLETWIHHRITDALDTEQPE